MQLPVLTIGNTSTSKQAVSDTVFAVENSPVLLAQAVRVYLSQLRQGTAKTKTRAEVARTKKKWFKQKGTGNARHGARTPNIFVGGGVSHGPTGTQNWSLALSGKMKHQALATALTAQASDTFLMALDSQMDAKALRKTLTALQPNEENILVILAQTDLEVIRKIRNMAHLSVTTASQVTALDVVQAHVVIIAPEAVTVVENRLNGVKAEVVETKVVVKAEKAEKVEKVAAVKKPAKVATKAVAAKKTKKTETK